jgi:hypothetical protein
LAAITGRIFDRLRAPFDKQILFRDDDVIQIGSDFRKAVEDSHTGTHRGFLYQEVRVMLADRFASRGLKIRRLRACRFDPSPGHSLAILNSVQPGAGHDSYTGTR